MPAVLLEDLPALSPDVPLSTIFYAQWDGVDHKCSADQIVATGLNPAAASSGTGSDCVIRAQSAGGTAAAAGGNVILCGGGSAGTGPPGSVVVRIPGDSGNKFKVDGATGLTTVLGELRISRDDVPVVDRDSSPNIMRLIHSTNYLWIKDANGSDAQIYCGAVGGPGGQCSWTFPQFGYIKTTSGNLGVGVAGFVATARNTIPSTGEVDFMGDFPCLMWFDKTTGSPKVKFRAKQGDGTYAAGELALTPE